MEIEDLKIVFESSYDQSNWIRVLKDLFKVKNIFIKPQVLNIPDKGWDAVGFELGNFETSDGRLIGIYEVKINNQVKIEKNKIGLRNLLKPIYANDVDAALIVFDQGDKWRFSYVSEIRVLNKETNIRERIATDPKRYTYLFGKGEKGRTAAERFKLINAQSSLFDSGISLKDIEKAFSVENLTKEFYKELSDWYLRALKVVEYPDDIEKDRNTRNATNTIRLITRLIFVWFLKQKRLVPDQLFEMDEVAQLINFEDKTGSTYYKAILQNLFFATLNTEMGDTNRKFVSRQYGVQGYYRYNRYFKNADGFLDLTKNIPFLNGGLFENLDKNVGEVNEIRIDCFSNAKVNETRLKVPDTLFFATETIDLSAEYDDKNKSSQTVRGLIDILQSYNFTIEENTPIEIEVALDPELLGKVFENLLASYVPETATTARKITGSFYTPRDVVDYMVDESLKCYLQDFIPPSPENKEALNNLLSYSTDRPRFNEENTKQLIRALNEARIVDPACGSGAFPMGVLHKMVACLTKLDPKNNEWRELQKHKALAETEEAYKLGNREEREQRLLDISEAFEDNSDDYGRKLYLIENCIYGIDIQPIAVQISKLRFFISLICDQEINAEKKNLGVRPLPNLETKFVAANTLIGLNKPKQTALRNLKIEELEEELNNVRHRHFNAKTPKTKFKWRVRDEELRKQIGELLKNDGWANDTAEKVAFWNPYDQNTFASFFDNEWMFGLIKGFDIVIGNPPYVSLQRMGDTESLRKANYSTFEKTGDLYSLFYEQGINILKPNGVLCYITSNKWINANYGKSTRKYFATQTNPLILIDFAKVKIFDAATVFVNILITQKAINKNKLQACSIEGAELPEMALGKYFDQNSFELKNLDENVWKVNNAGTLGINEIIEARGAKLENKDIWKGINFFRGITTGFNDGFYIRGYQRDILISQNPKNELIIKPLLRGKDIKRWKYQFEDWYMINSHNGVKGGIQIPRIDIPKNYPEIFAHFSQFSDGMKNRQDQGVHWTNLRDCAFISEFEKPKIVWIEISDRANYAYDESGMFLTNSAYFISGDSLKYILAVLNSKVADYYFFQITATIAGGRKRYTKQYVEKIPIPHINAEAQKPFEKIVDYILYLKEHPDDQQARLAVQYYETILDTMVYELYFTEQVKNAGLEIIKYIAPLPFINDVNSGDNLTSLIDSYNTLYQKDNPVRNSTFFIDSIPEIKEIADTFKTKSHLN